MLEATGCRRVVAQASMRPLVDQLRTEMQARGVQLQIDTLPDLDVVFPRIDVDEGAAPAIEPYPERNSPSTADRVAMYIHSSGSTGTPKSIPFTERRMFEWATHSTSLTNYFLPCELNAASCSFYRGVPLARHSVRCYGASDIPLHGLL